MSDKMVDVTLHLDENISHEDRENFRDSLLILNGVMAAACHDEKPHLIIIEYNPDTIKSSEFVKAAQDRGLHAELVGL
ncbi:MAG: ATP-binding protein [Gammaproteobacteria bacterium]|nr:ATP-binding protein [Gammaproteobacteria bacterium]